MLLFFFLLPCFLMLYASSLSHSLQLGNFEHLLTNYCGNPKWNATSTHHHGKSTKPKICHFLFSQLFRRSFPWWFSIRGKYIGHAIRSEWIRSRLNSTNNYNESITCEFSGYSVAFSLLLSCSRSSFSTSSSTFYLLLLCAVLNAEKL